jgi:hypothetical protein
MKNTTARTSPRLQHADDGTFTVRSDRQAEKLLSNNNPART